MGRIKVVLLFNEDDEKQNVVGTFLKSQQRCKTALITGVLYDWITKKDRSDHIASSPPDMAEEDLLDKLKNALLADTSFIKRVSELILPQTVSAELVQNSREGKLMDETELDMDEDLLLTGLSMFETQI